MLKNVAIWIVVVLAISVLFLVWCYHGENSKNYFASYDDAIRSGIMEAGWIPTFIPKSSYGLKETHNIDTNVVRMSFKYDPEDKGSVKKYCLLGDPLTGGEKYHCEYYSREFTINLYSDGSAELYSKGG